MENIALVVGAIAVLSVSVGLAWAPPDSLFAWPMFTEVSVLIAWDRDGAPMNLRALGMSPEDSGVTSGQLIEASEFGMLPEGFYGYLLSGNLVLRVKRESDGHLLAERYRSTGNPPFSLPQDMIARLRAANSADSL